MRITPILLLAAAAVLSSDYLASGQSPVVTRPFGFFGVRLNSSPSTPLAHAISAPVYARHAYRGQVASVAGNIITFSGSPGFTVNAYGPVNLGGSAGAFTQYIVLVRQDADKTPADPNNVTGDWWQITANGANSVTVNPAQGDPAALLGAGDELEIRKLTSLKDLFGPTADGLNTSNDGIPNTADEDVIRTLAGTTFVKTIFYYNGTVGGGTPQWIVAGTAAGDGSAVTFEPDETFILYRKAGSPVKDVLATGEVQTTRLTHYLQEGGNVLANPFLVNALLSGSNLKESGWISSANGFAETANEDVIRPLIGTSFGSSIFHISNGMLNTWVQGQNTSPALSSGGSYVVFIKTGSGGRIWRQNVPFSLD